METFEALSDDQVAEEIATWASRVAAGEARLLALIGEFDARDAWSQPGFLSCAHWLSWRIGWGTRAAYEKVKVARALRGLPQTLAAFSRGQLSWTQVRAICRVAVAADEHVYIDLARHASGAQLEKIARGVRRARMLAAIDAARQQLDTERAAECSAEDSIPQDLAAECSAEHSRPPRTWPAGEDSDPTVRASIAEGLVRVAQTSLATATKGRADVARRARQRLTALVDPLSGWTRLADGELLPPNAAPPSAAELRAHLRPIVAADLTRFDLGRTARVLSPQLRELLGQIDGERCRFPGCTRRRKLHGHHVIYWSAGGPTDLSNLVLLCSRHHTVVHAQGFGLTLRPDRTLKVTTGDGVPVLHHPTLTAEPAAALDPDGLIGPATLPPMTSYDRLDLEYVVWVLMQHAA
ncbi:MAG TPA: DUF222 domain-containing protein [Mycobacteriales bacterium]|nr:DUF222 domain-containing protein [Mycobacteriales bacterium]